jgi:putative endonuclease
MTGIHYVYLVQCADGTYYTGYTTDVTRRVAEHNAGRGARYTRSRRPVQLVHAEEWPSRSAALQREAALRRLPRQVKQSLAEGGVGSG